MTATESKLQNVLRVRLGTALQKHRLRQGLTQAQLAELADLSLKYVGEIERGEANTTLEALERLARAVEWDPMETLEGTHEPVSEGVRVLLMAEVRTFVDRFQVMLQWLEALDPALHPVQRLSLPRICMGHPVFIDAAGNIIPMPPTFTQPGATPPASPPGVPPGLRPATTDPPRRQRRVRRRKI